MKTRQPWVLCSIASLLGACGSAASFNYDLPPPVESVESPPLQTMSGQIVGGKVEGDHVGLALVWLPVLPGQGRSQISQTVKYTPSLGGVDIAISKLPPDESLESADMMRYARAEVLVYEDGDRNGKLNIEPGDTSPDRVLGRAKGVRIWWLGEGTPAPLEELGRKPVKSGWSSTYGPIPADKLEVGDCAPDPQPGGARHTRCPLKIREPARDVSPQQLMTITVSDERILKSYACRGFWGTSSEQSDEWPDDTPGWNAPEIRRLIAHPENWNCKGDVCPLDLPVAGRTNLKTPLTCNPDKSEYVWQDCEPDPKLCGTVFCHRGSGRRDKNQPPPENWPICDRIASTPRLE